MLVVWGGLVVAVVYLARNPISDEHVDETDVPGPASPRDGER
ncbi:hypothetical protein [Georgenia halophila]